jgi:hypothetical protein
MEPWEFRTDDVRVSDSKKLFIIFCEDGAVEPAYFQFFQRNDLQVSAFGNKKQHHAQVDYATEFFRKSDLIELDEFNREILKLEDGAQVWCVFDRDKEPSDGKDTAFNDSIMAANSKGIKTAWSNDDFELWVLLHFEDVDPENVDFYHRTKYYERLTEVLKQRLPEEPLFQNPMFDYYTAMKSKKRFIQYTYTLMKDNLEIAIQRSKDLEEYHSTTPKPPHLHCPCTKIHHLVIELLS